MVKKLVKPRAKVKGRGKVAAKKPAAKRAAKVSAPAKKPVKKSVKSDIRVKLFVAEYLKSNFNATKAAIACGFSAQSARVQGCEFLATPEVQAELARAVAARAQRLEIDADDLVRRIYDIGTADARELIALEYGCCRYCWGKSHRFQWTVRELREAIEEHQHDVKIAAGDVKVLAKIKAPDEAGGVGFNPNNDPNPKCPECFGKGEQRVVPKDTRDLSPAARLLYAGVKTTQHGLEIKMHDQMAALLNVGKHMGLFKTEVKHSGNLGVHKTVTDLLDEIDGAGTGLPAHASRSG
jgi:phage terminase small subunit